MANIGEASAGRLKALSEEFVNSSGGAGGRPNMAHFGPLPKKVFQLLIGSFSGKYVREI